MSRYRKLWAAVLGGLAQVMVFMDAALSAGVVPDGWRPWVVAALAVGTAYGVYRAPNAPPAARHSMDSRGDAGAVSLRVVLALFWVIWVTAMAVLILLLRVVAE